MPVWEELICGQVAEVGGWPADWRLWRSCVGRLLGSPESPACSALCFDPVVPQCGRPSRDPWLPLVPSRLSTAAFPEGKSYLTPIYWRVLSVWPRDSYLGLCLRACPRCSLRLVRCVLTSTRHSFPSPVLFRLRLNTASPPPFSKADIFSYFVRFIPSHCLSCTACYCRSLPLPRVRGVR